jgi:hypothetical protein
MDSQRILNKIANLIGLDKVVNLSGDVYAKLEDGTAVASDAFSVGHTLFVLGEDGSKKVAPDGTHKVYIGGPNGSKCYALVVKDGTISQMDLDNSHNTKEITMNKDLFAKGQEKIEQLAQANDEPVMKGTAPKYDNTTETPVNQKDAEGFAAEDGMDIASRIDALGAEIKSLREDIAQLFADVKKDTASDVSEQEMGMESKNEKSAVDEIQKKGLGAGGQGKPNYGGPSATNMSAQKKFTGAPVEEQQPMKGLFQSKQQNTMSTVFSKMNNSRL